MNNPIRSTFGLAIALILSARIICAQTNPTGVSGQFNGDVTTGCNYDPFTGNARRAISDLTVAGAVGSYPLAFGRTALSRYDTSGAPPIATYFGMAGNWRHSYQWSIDVMNCPCKKCGLPTYTVNYPDGRRVQFDSAAENGNDVYYRRAGVRDRFEPGLFCGLGPVYLHLADGGKVTFSETSGPNGNSFQLQSITDPYGQVTNITYPADGNTLITEPAGRWIKIFFRTITQASEGAIGDTIIDHVTASDGRSVQYTYHAYIPPADGTTYTTLTGVTYFGDPTLTATYTYKPSNIFGMGRPLLASCNDPMYGGPMRKISYTYQDAVYAQPTPPPGCILSENSGTTGQTVSSLNGGTGYSAVETRADGKSRSFTYGPPALLYNWTDFKAISVSQTYDTRSFVNSFTDGKGNTTNWTNDIKSGHVTSISYPLTPNDTPSGTPRGTVTFTYASATCPDPNNRDANNPYYLYSQTDEGGHTTVYLRDANKRITQINYPDGGSESFTYNSFGQVLTHGMRTGGTESFTYDARGLKQTYRDAYHQSGNPNAWCQYDSLDRLSGVTDALGSASGDVNHTTNYTYNSRGQLLVITLPVDPTDGQRHTIQNTYNSNSDGTLVSVTDQLGHVTSFAYDDYRRVRSMTSPGHNTPVTAYTYYDANGTGEDYTHTDSNVTHATAAGGEKTTNAYDEDFRNISTIIGDGTSDAAKRTFGYDNNGNVTSVISPNEQPGQPFAGKSTITVYDERNRIMSVMDALNNITTFKYNAAGCRASLTKANGQVITYDSYDPINRLLQQTAKQTPDPDAVTKYTYYTSGLLHTMQDPRLVANNSPYNYNYGYDQMGRKTGLTYPPDSGGVQRTESWHYDTAGRLDTFTNRDVKVQTIGYDGLNRETGFSWNDGVTPSVSFAYDVANRMTRVVNANATIARTYFSDNLLNTETTSYADNTPRTMTYAYNADGNRATIQYPSGAYSFTYNYTGRNQLKTLLNNSGGAIVATYAYDPDGNLATRTPDNFTNSAYTYDALDRVTHITHALVGNTRTFDYAYDAVSNRKWAKRDGANGDVFGYDLNNQSIATLLNVPNPDTTSVGAQTINYDANGNRTAFSAYGPTDTYTTNSLNQYTTRNSSQAIYDTKGNLTTGFDSSSYTYDAQSRLLSAIKAGTTETFKYDGLNRQISRTIGAGSPTYNVYDGWTLIGEYAPGATTASTAYLSGTGGLVKNLTTNRYYYQDASGSTSHLVDSTGHLLEWYRYDLQGTPVFYNASNSQISSSNYGVRQLFTGEQWYSELGLYDLRNRFYSPDIGRFVQSDPAGFSGDASNLYRYCSNNPLKKIDPLGLGPPSGSTPIHEPEQGASGGGFDPYGGSYFGSSGYFGDQGVVVNGYDPFGLGSPLGIRTFDRAHLSDAFAIGGWMGISGGDGVGSQSSFGDWPGSVSLGGRLRSSPGLPPLPSNPFAGPVQLEIGIIPGSVANAGTIEYGVLNLPSLETLAAGPSLFAQAVDWAANNLDYTVDFAQTLGVVPVGDVPVPVGVHGFLTIDKSGITIGAGPGAVAAEGVVGMVGHPFGESSGVELVSQVFYSPGPFGGYVSGVPFSQGAPSWAVGGAWGMGSGASITLDGTIHFNWPNHR
jgi:RHS repeat-associated protein